MEGWPPFVIETPGEESAAGRGWEEVVFELEDSIAEIEGEPEVLLREKP